MTKKTLNPLNDRAPREISYLYPVLSLFYILVGLLAMTQAIENFDPAGIRLPYTSMAMGCDQNPPTAVQKISITIHGSYFIQGQSVQLKDVSPILEKSFQCMTESNPIISIIIDSSEDDHFSRNFENSTSGFFLHDLSLVLRVDRNCPFGYVSDLMRELQEAGFYRVHFATTHFSEA